MDDILRLMRALMQGPGDSVGLDNVEGVIVSTVVTSDYGPETAIMTADDHTAPVERYSNREEALEGHQAWVKRIRDERPTQVTMLGYGDLVEDETVAIRYDAEWSEEEFHIIRARIERFTGRLIP